MNLILSIWTVVVFLLFIAICFWAWSGRKKQDFEEAAQIPFQEDDDNMVEEKELNNG